MNIPILNSYNPYIQNENNYKINNDDNRLNQENITSKQNEKDKSQVLSSEQAYISKLENTQDDLLSQNERDYFMQLFPDRRDIIEKHIVFNRNGKVSQSNLSKGMILDGKV